MKHGQRRNQIDKELYTKTLVIGHGFNRVEKVIKSYGRDLNRLKKEIATKFNLNPILAHNLVRKLNRHSKVLFNDGTVSFVLSIKEKVTRGVRTQLKYLNNLIGREVFEKVEDSEGHYYNNTDKVQVFTYDDYDYYKRQLLCGCMQLIEATETLLGYTLITFKEI